MSCEILYLAYNRLEFTKASLDALCRGTDWNLVDRFIAWDDGSTDGTLEFLQEKLKEIAMVVPVTLCQGRARNPVNIMRKYLHGTQAEVFAKIDNDVVVPPGWLDACMTVMDENPQLDLLGIEPPASRKGSPQRPTPQPTAALETAPGPLRWVPTDAIGGIGLMRTNCFSRFTNGRGLVAQDTYGGFTGWQIFHSQENGLRCGWIAPALKVFLLDRVPEPPWDVLSKEYIKNSWQRPWRMYSLEDKEELWAWWSYENAYLRLSK